MSDIEPAQLYDFATEGVSLRDRTVEDPLPVVDHNDWVARMNKYFESIGKPEYKVRLNDFTGMTLYGDGSDKSQFEKSIEGRIRRLHEFLGELSAQNISKSGTASSRSENNVLFLKPSFFGLGIDLRAAWRRFFCRKEKKQ